MTAVCDLCKMATHHYNGAPTWCVSDNALHLTPTIADFLLARIADGELDCPPHVIEQAATTRDRARASFSAGLLRGLALDYVDHPEYRPEWRS